jgi:hypothetical protein
VSKELEAANELHAASAGALLHDPIVQQALAVCAAASSGDYHRFFALYAEALRMSPYLMDLFVERVRMSALRTIVRAYRPSIPRQFVAGELAFESSGACKKWLREKGAVLSADRRAILCKETIESLAVRQRELADADGGGGQAR